MSEHPHEETDLAMVASWVPAETKAALEGLAKANTRSVSGEIRVALAKHLAESAQPQS